MKVLVAENNAELLKLLSHLIEREGFIALTATGGGAALKIYREQKPDIICLDILMEDMSGYDVCREIRRNDKVTPVIFITSKSGAAAERDGREAGGDEYIVKPFDLKEVKKLMRHFARQCIEKSAPEALDKTLDFGGGLVVMPNRLMARRHEDSLDLSLMEVSLLDYFFLHPGRDITLDELHTNVFRAFPSVADRRTVDVHVQQLIKKLETDPAAPQYILPLAGGGYRYGT